MTAQLIFVPVLAHVSLVFLVYFLLLRRKVATAKSTKVDFKATALNCKAWPDEAVLKCSNNLDNQFQAPVLFYIISFVLFAVDGVNLATLVLAWTFVFSRYLHCYIHTGRNYVPHRMKVFAVGIVTLAAMTAIAGYQLWVTYL
jgi:hypothetical protein